MKKLFKKIFGSDKTNTFKKIIYLVYFIGLLCGGALSLIVGIGLGDGFKGNFFDLIAGLGFGLYYAFIFSFPAFLTFITAFNFVEFLISKFTNYWTKKPAFYNWLSFVAVILTLVYAYLIIPYYLPNVGSVTYQVNYPVIFPQAILLLVWIVHDLTGFFIKNTTQSEHKKVFGLLKTAWIQIIVVLVLTTIVFATRFETISNYFGATNEKILHLDYDGQVEKMCVVDNDNLLLFGQSNSNNNIFNGSTSTYLMMRNIKENKIVWAIPDKFIKTIYFDKNQQKVYAVASKNFAEIKPSNPTDLLIIEARTGQISQTISLNDKPLKYISNINVNPTGEVLLSGATDNFTKNIFNLTTNSFLKDQFSSIISFSARSKLSDNGKFLLNIANQVQPVQFSVIDLTTNQKILEYQKELTSYNGYNNDYTIAGNYVITFDEQKNMFEVFVSERESSLYQSDFNQKLSFNFQTKKVEETRENISWQLASKNLADKYGVINSAGTRLTYTDQSSMKIFKVENQKMTLARTIKLADKYQGMNKGYTFLPGTSTLVLASRYGQLHFFDIN